MESLNETAKTQFKVQKRKFDRDVEEVLGKDKKSLSFRIGMEETDYSLLNYALTIFDFTECTDLNEVLLKFYRSIYPILRDQQQQNEKLKEALAEHEPGSPLLDFMGPFERAHDTLKKLQERARERAKSGIKGYTEEDAKDLGIDLDNN